MDLYNVALFAHIVGAIFIVGMGFFNPFMANALTRTPTVAGVREWAGVLHKISKAGGPFALLILASGIYMVIAQYSFAQPWVIVSLVLFVVAGGIASGVLDPAIAKIVAAAKDTPDGPVPDELRALTTNSRMHDFEAMLFGVDLALVFLMAVKPGLLGALAVVVAGVAVGGIRIALAHRRHEQTPAVAG